MHFGPVHRYRDAGQRVVERDLGLGRFNVSSVSIADWWPRRFCTALIEQFLAINSDA